MKPALATSLEIGQPVYVRSKTRRSLGIILVVVLAFAAAGCGTSSRNSAGQRPRRQLVRASTTQTTTPSSWQPTPSACEALSTALSAAEHTDEVWLSQHVKPGRPFPQIIPAFGIPTLEMRIKICKGDLALLVTK